MKKMDSFGPERAKPDAAILRPGPPPKSSLEAGGGLEEKTLYRKTVNSGHRFLLPSPGFGRGAGGEGAQHATPLEAGIAYRRGTEYMIESVANGPMLCCRAVPIQDAIYES
jgi:hypothetical protein